MQSGGLEVHTSCCTTALCSELAFLLLLFQERAERLVINASAISKCQGTGGFECIKPDLVGPHLQDFWAGPARSYTLALPLALAVPGVGAQARPSDVIINITDLINLEH